MYAGAIMAIKAHGLSPVHNKLLQSDQSQSTIQGTKKNEKRERKWEENLGGVTEQLVHLAHARSILANLKSKESSYCIYCASATTGQTGASLRVKDGTRSRKAERGERGADQCCNVRAKMEEPSIHSIGDINSAETTKSKCESVNRKLFAISFLGRKIVLCRYAISYGRYATIRFALALILFWIYTKDRCIFT